MTAAQTAQARNLLLRMCPAEMLRVVHRSSHPTDAAYKRFMRDPKNRRKVDWWFARVTKLFWAHDWARLVPIVERAEGWSPPPAIYWAVRARGGEFTSEGLRWLAATPREKWLS